MKLPWPKILTHYLMPVIEVDGLYCDGLDTVHHPAGVYVLPKNVTLAQRYTYVWARRRWTRLAVKQLHRVRDWWDDQSTWLVR